MLLIGTEWLRIDQGCVSCVNLFHVGELPGVPMWSLALSSKAMRGPLVALVI